MEKGNSGITLEAIAAAAFVLCFLNWSTALVLILGFALIIEKNQWLTKQIMKAFYLMIGYSLMVSIIGIAFDLLYKTIGNINFIYNLLRTVDSLIGIVIEIGLLVICLVTAIKVTKREDTTIPLIDELADKTLGIIPMQSNHE